MDDRSAPEHDGLDAVQRREAELTAAREIAASCLTASSAVEVYRRALARSTPLVGAAFASVFLRDAREPELLRLACAHNWPQASARFLADLRIRSGRGPTGRAVTSSRPVEVADVFADPALEDWWEPARELGFVSMTAHPLVVDGGVLGALSFYFRQRQRFDDHARTLLGIVAHQLALTAEKTGPGYGAGNGSLQSVRETEALHRKVLPDDEAPTGGGPAGGD